MEERKERHVGRDEINERSLAERERNERRGKRY